MPIIVQANPGLETRPSNLTCLAPAPVSSCTNMVLARTFPNLGFNNPVTMLQAPDDNSRWYVAERSGRILRFDNDPAANNPRTVLDIRRQVTFGVEGGLMGIAFHPDFSRNGQMYLSYTGPRSPFVSYYLSFYQWR